MKFYFLGWLKFKIKYILGSLFLKYVVVNKVIGGLKCKRNESVN